MKTVLKLTAVAAFAFALAACSNDDAASTDNSAATQTTAATMSNSQQCQQLKDQIANAAPNSQAYQTANQQFQDMNCEAEFKG